MVDGGDFGERIHTDNGAIDEQNDKLSLCIPIGCSFSQCTRLNRPRSSSTRP